MKRWLRRIVIAVGLLAVVVGVLFEIGTHVGRGRLFGEPFYEGRPASYWANEIECWQTEDAAWQTQSFQRRPVWPRWIERMLPKSRWPRLLDGDPDGLAVLHALRNHPSSDVQDWARIGIERIDNGERGPRKIKHPSVIVTAQLYEVDEAFYQEVAKAKWLSTTDLEKMERLFIERLDRPEKVPAEATLFDRLGKKKLVLMAKDIKIEINQERLLLSLTQETNCLPSPVQRRKGQNAAQTIAEGLVLRADAQVSSDRRFVRMKFIEKSTQLEGIEKTSVVIDDKGTLALAEMAFVKESTLATMRNLPDGGSLLLPLQSRPGNAKETGRWYVARIEARIYIDAEEETPFRGAPPK